MVLTHDEKEFEAFTTFLSKVRGEKNTCLINELK